MTDTRRGVIASFRVLPEEKARLFAFGAADLSRLPSLPHDGVQLRDGRRVCALDEPLLDDAFRCLLVVRTAQHGDQIGAQGRFLGREREIPQPGQPRDLFFGKVS